MKTPQTAHRRAVTPLLLLLPLSAAIAQTAPDAGTLLQQSGRERTTVLPQTSPVPKDSAVPRPRAAGTAVTIQRFRFEGNQRFESARLAEVVAGYLNRPLDVEELQDAGAAVATLYREHGWLARVVLPRQEITEGTVTLRVVEAVFGTTQIDADGAAETAPLQVSPDTLKRFIGARQKSGQPLNMNDLERGMLLADDLPGVAVVGSLGAGQREAETDMLLRVRNERPAQLTLTTDNHGSRGTGAGRVLGDGQLNSPFGLGEQVGLSSQLSQGVEYGRASASVPLGHDGWRAGVNASAMRYRVTGADFAALQPEGRSTAVSTDLTHALVRQHDRNVYLTAGIDHKRFRNGTLTGTTSDYRLTATQLGVSGNLNDALGGGGLSSASLSLTLGRLNLDGSPHQANDAQTLRTEGSFTKWRYRLSRQQALTQGLSLQGTLSGQRASKNLDSSEKFSLGGPDGVRAYPISEGSGAAGDLFNAELRWLWPASSGCGTCVLSAFYDWGRVTVNRHNDGAGAATLNHHTLRGHGLTMSWQGPGGLGLSATWARRHGVNPNPTTSGADQDGSAPGHRVWLSASLSF